MAGLWPLRLRSLHADFCAGERVMGVSWHIGSWCVRPRSSHAGPCASERVMGISWHIRVLNVSVSRLDGSTPAITTKLLTNSPLRQQTQYYSNAAAPPTISVISVVIAACRARLY
ncbi:hypothetical protein EFV51_09415 [Lacticaseibacillus rhamnosus]|nr:hypothetical protein [Lacticaseibacillus rhamnosus]